MACLRGAAGVTPTQRAAAMLLRRRPGVLAGPGPSPGSVPGRGRGLSTRAPSVPCTPPSHTHAPRPRLAAPSVHAAQRHSSAWSAAVSVAGNIVTNALGRAKKNELAVDPLRAVAKEMKFLIGDVRKLLGSGHPSLDRAAKYYTQAEGKHMRPLIVLLMSRATFLCPKAVPVSPPSPNPNPLPAPLRPSGVDTAISPLNVLSDFNPTAPTSTTTSTTSTSTSTTSTSPAFTTPSSFSGAAPAAPTAEDLATPEILPSQRRLAEITELIHTASLLHDDVIDHSESRRGAPSANVAFGNKMAVLAGDFLLGRASVALARLRNAEVVELLATVIANLVEGEFMQLKNTARDEARPQWSDATVEYYLQKTYLKTASLISKSCRAAALLGGADAATVEAAYQYGKNLGLAFQLVDDMLDYTRSAAELGKPAGADLELGLATAPLLFAWRTRPELGELVGRKFSQPGDAQKARDIVHETDGIEQTRRLAQEYAERAMAAIAPFPDSEAKDGLVEMAIKTLKRQK